LRRLRNRLAHYNEEPTIVDQKDLNRPMTEGAGLEEIMEALPDPKIVIELLNLDVEEQRKEILRLGVWLQALLANLRDHSGSALIVQKIQQSLDREITRLGA